MISPLTEKQVSQTLKPYGVTLEKRQLHNRIAYRVFLKGKLETAIYTTSLIDALESGIELHYQ